MLDVDRILARIASRSDRKGLVLRADALAEGIPLPVLDLRVRAGILIVLYDGVYRHAAAPYTQDLRDLAAVLACGADAALSHASAARLHGFPGVRAIRPVVTTPHTDLPRMDDVIRHRTRRLLPSEVTVVRGIRVTARGRTALDYCGVTPVHIAREVIAQAVIAKVLKPEQIVTAIERSGGRGRPGTSALRAIAVELPELEGIESALELIVARIVDAARVPRAVRQYEMVCDDGRRVRLDLAWPDRKVALEPNGRLWHDTPARKRATRERQESIRSTGWEHRHVGFAEADDDPDEIRTWVEATYRARAEVDDRRHVA